MTAGIETENIFTEYSARPREIKIFWPVFKIQVKNYMSIISQQKNDTDKHNDLALSLHDA